MTAATADRDTKQLAGDVRALPVAASTTIYLGTLVATNATGYLVSATDSAAVKFAGVASEGVDNSSGSDGDLYCRVYTRRLFDFAASGLTAADVGKPLYVTDNQTVQLAAAALPCGWLAEYVSATVARVAIDAGLIGSVLAQAGGKYLALSFHWSGAVGDSGVKLMEDMEFPFEYKVKRAYASCATAPGSGYQCDIVWSDGTTSFTVVIDDTATVGENETEQATPMLANTDTDVTATDDNASGATADVNVLFILEIL